MIKKIRNFGEYPMNKDSGDQHFCEICRAIGDLNEDLGQCFECGRWVCDECWDVEKGICKICAKHPQNTEKLEESHVKRLNQLEEEMEEIKNIVKDLNIKLDKIKFCPFCNAPAPKSAKYCGICGKLI